MATEHPLHPVIYRTPNPWQTSFALRETMMYHVLLTGNAFAWKGMVGTNQDIRALEPIEPGRVVVKRSDNGDLRYVVRADNGQRQYSTRIKSGICAGLRGTHGWAWMRPSWRGMPSDCLLPRKAHAEFHKGNARISGLLSLDDAIGKEKFEFLSAWLDRHSEGGDRAGKPLVMDKAAKWQSFAMSGVDSQHLETRKHQIEEICRGLGVMPIMVGHADKTATYASAEQMFLAHVVHTLSPWYERIEQSANAHLLSDKDRAEGYYTKFTPNALMRGAAAIRRPITRRPSARHSNRAG